MSVTDICWFKTIDSVKFQLGLSVLKVLFWRHLKWLSSWDSTTRSEVEIDSKSSFWHILFISWHRRVLLYKLSQRNWPRCQRSPVWQRLGHDRSDSNVSSEPWVFKFGLKNGPENYWKLWKSSNWSKYENNKIRQALKLFYFVFYDS